ncbi:MAG: prephenate dehydrogenase/arogenate dehydrogenase family protein [Deltaproteobacteria bacterium]|nr:prephenate dehydrogenase/arogenate dehydrogenase family protein [Deltaproteobacteria bacterium]MBN2846293.1 prephenate dehydrogenase/arogenate dehydrogenase family protein [Deltaproteobacteria bacterium]
MMERIEIGIIGGTGGMGRWFATFLKKEGYAVHVSGRKIGMDMEKMAKTCPVVIVSVPIGITCEIIERIGPLMERESLLMDLTSLKEKPVKAMLESTNAEVIGLHPLFGPRVRSMSGQNIALCPVRTEKWHRWVSELLKKGGARIIETTPERHDEMMSLVQGLTHLTTIIMGLILRDMGVDKTELDMFSTPVFRTKLAFIEKIFTDNPTLYGEIIAENPNIDRILESYQENLMELKGILAGKKTKALIDLIGKKM